MHHKDTKVTKKQENRSVKAKIAQSWPDFMLLCALCVFVVEILFQAATRHGLRV
jgi:hypothetical protein